MQPSYPDGALAAWIARWRGGSLWRSSPRSAPRSVFRSHALIVNEIAIVALFAVSLDLMLGYAGIVSAHAAFFGFGRMPRRCSPRT